MPKYAKKERDPKTELCASNLRALLRYKNMSVPDLAKRIGVSARTIEAYTAGRVSLPDAKASTILHIAKELKVDPYILIGDIPIEIFFRKEEATRKRRADSYQKMLAERKK